MKLMRELESGSCSVDERNEDHNMQEELDKSQGPLVCADYYSPRDRPGDPGVTSIAFCLDMPQF